MTKQSQSTIAILKQSIRDIFSSLKLIFPFLLLIVFAKDVVMQLGGLPHDRVMAYCIAFIVTCLQIFGWAACLLAVDANYRGQHLTLSQIYQKTVARIPQILATFFLMVLILVGVFYVGFLVSHFLKLNGLNVGIFQLFYIGLPIFVLIILMLFAVPLAVIENKNVMANFIESAKLIGVKNFPRVFVLYALIAFFVLLLLPGTKHSDYFIKHYLIVPFDLVVVFVLGTFLVNFTMWLLNDLQSRQS